MQPSPSQFRAARALLRRAQGDVARRAQVSTVTVRRIEGADGDENIAFATQEAVRRALERAGVEFIADGVRWCRAADPKSGSLYDDLRAISLRSAERLRDPVVLVDADLYDENGLPV